MKIFLLILLLPVLFSACSEPVSEPVKIFDLEGHAGGAVDLPGIGTCIECGGEISR